MQLKFTKQKKGITLNWNGVHIIENQGKKGTFKWDCEDSGRVDSVFVFVFDMENKGEILWFDELGREATSWEKWVCRLSEIFWKVWKTDCNGFSDIAGGQGSGRKFNKRGNNFYKGADLLILL